MQTTVKRPITLEGVGLHSGQTARVTILPASANAGISFLRTDAVSGDRRIPALWNLVEVAPLCTRLVNDDGVYVQTVEHIMAALAGTGVHNALVEVSGPEVPILDGSSAEFVRAILAAGIKTLEAPLYVWAVRKAVTVRNGPASATLSPAPALSIEFEIEFPDSAIGRQSRRLHMSNGSFVRELCDSRTFCRAADIQYMHANGLALGGTYDNAVVVDGAEIVSPGGLRWEDEPVRHKMLDALGDLALAGAPLLGTYHGVRAGHAMTNQLLRKLFATPGAVELVEASPAEVALLPGVGVDLSDMSAVA